MNADELNALQRIGQLHPGQPVVLSVTGGAAIAGEVVHLVYGEDNAALGVVLAAAHPDSPSDTHHVFVPRSNINAVEWEPQPDEDDEPSE